MLSQEVYKCNGAWNVCKLSSGQERDGVLPVCYLVDSATEKGETESIGQVSKETM